MKLIKSIFREVSLSFAGRERKVHFFFLFMIFMSFFMESCVDDMPDSNPSGTLQEYTGDFRLVDLPGTLGLALAFEGDGFSSRSNTETSDGNPFKDGDTSEYAIATEDGDEYYNYLIFFDGTGSSKLLFKIDPSTAQKDPNDGNNVTLTISKMFVKGDDNGELDAFDSVVSFSNYIANLQPYVLLNFKLDPSEPNFYSATPLTGSNTLQILNSITRSQLESLQMTDYKITKRVVDASGTSTRDYFIMSNSVYAGNSAKIIDGKVYPEKVYPTEEAAAADPALVVHVERLASKISVSFNTSRMGTANFDPYGKMMLNNVSIDNATGLPVLTLTVQRVDMSHPGGIRFDNNGYEIQTINMAANLKIVGYGLSNVENRTNLFKNINYMYGNVSWQWNDPSNYRSYWSQDPNYEFRYAESDNFTKVEGYPHQFRLALDTDTVASLHKGLDGGYLDYSDYEEEYYIGEGEDRTRYVAYNKLGKINTDARYQNVALQYKSFNTLMDEYERYVVSSSETDGGNRVFYPLYTLENTYFDQGMLTGGDTWRWDWQRAPYAAATNFILLAQIIFPNNYDTSTEVSSQTQTAPQNLMPNTRGFDSSVRTVYLGQNDIFYLKKVNLLNSKLAILKQVMLSGGNAGIQILHGQWDRHTRWDEGDVNQGNDVHLDKVAWNEGSVLWYAEIATDDSGQPIYDKVYNTEDPSKYTYRARFNEENPPFQASIDINKSDDEEQALDLIPAEISGGDGQCLIAPSRKYMGKKWKYFLAPVKKTNIEITDPTTGGTTETVKEEMDTDNAVEISYNHLVALIHKIIGPVDVYRYGLMYFSVPVPHRYSSINSSNWANFGAYNVVRNNWYDISVSEITHLGTPIDDPEQPIIPVMDVKRSYINMGVELLNWHEITEDNIPVM